MPANEELLAASAVELRRRIGSREISPVELLEACIERIARINPAVNAVTATCYDRARKEAKAAEKAVLNGETLGLLHGLPRKLERLSGRGGHLRVRVQVRLLERDRNCDAGRKQRRGRLRALGNFLRRRHLLLGCGHGNAERSVHDVPRHGLLLGQHLDHRARHRAEPLHDRRLRHVRRGLLLLVARDGDH